MVKKVFISKGQEVMMIETATPDASILVFGFKAGDTIITSGVMSLKMKLRC
jgi:membrane fusion protein (multidrug efflux system)